MACARFSLSLALLGALSLYSNPAQAVTPGDPTSLTGVVPSGSSAIVTNVTDPVYAESAYNVFLEGTGSFVNSGGANYPQYESSGFGFTPTYKNYFYEAGFTYDGTNGNLTAIGGYAMVVHENSVQGGGYYYINVDQTEAVHTKDGNKAFTVTSTAAAPGSGASAQFAGFGGSDNPILAADRLTIAFYGVTNGVTDIVNMNILGPGAHAPRILEWKHDQSGVAGTHKPTTFVGSNDSAYNYQE